MTRLNAWRTGPYDDDIAMDFVDALLDLTPGEVAEAVTRAVCAVVDAEGQLGRTVAVQGVMAAVLLAGQPEPPPYLRSWLTSVELDVSPELADTALLALDRAYSADSELWQLWTPAGKAHEAWAVLTPARAALHRLATAAQETLF